jgi:hypothetical protein
MRFSIQIVCRLRRYKHGEWILDSMSSFSLPVGTMSILFWKNEPTQPHYCYREDPDDGSNEPSACDNREDDASTSEIISLSKCKGIFCLLQHSPWSTNSTPYGCLSLNLLLYQKGYIIHVRTSNHWFHVNLQGCLSFVNVDKVSNGNRELTSTTTKQLQRQRVKDQDSIQGTVCTRTSHRL